MSSPLDPLSLEWITELLAQPTAVAQAYLLQQANLWHETGLVHLIQTGGQLINRDVSQARALLDICLAFAQELAPTLQPQARYLRAQTFAFNGHFEQALAEIALAQADYQNTGQTAAALRTNIGLINILIHLGRYSQALETAEAALAAIDQTPELSPETAATLFAHLQNNQAICYKFMGRYADARLVYASAERRFREIGLEEDAANVQMNLGVMLAELGHGTEALAAYEAAAAIYAQTGNKWRQAQNLENKGEVHLWLGNYDQGLVAFADARSLFATLNASLEQYILERLTADAYLALNLLPEATAAYRHAIAGLEASETSPGSPYYLGGALWGLGATLLRRNRLAEAAELLSRAADIFAEAGNEHLLSAVLLEQAALAEAQGEKDTAILQTHQALALIANQDWPVQRVYANLRLADLLMPDMNAAESLLHEAQKITAELPLPQLRVSVQQRLGGLYLRQGRETEAESLLITAVTEIERLRGTLARLSLRTSFLQDKMAVYADLVRLYLARGDQDSLKKAFRVTEQAKSRTLLDLLSQDIAAQLQQNLNPDLAQRLQTMQADLNAIYNEALRDNPEGDRATRFIELNEHAIRLEEEISRLRLQADMDAPIYPLAQAMPFSALQETLPPDVPLLAYYALDDELLAFTYHECRLQVTRHLSRLSVVSEHMAALEIEWQRFQADRVFIHRHLARLTRSVQKILGALYQELIAPLADWLTDHPRLVVIPHSLLHQLPFAALFDGEHYLAESVELHIAPSATIFNLSRQRRLHPQGTAAIFGVDDQLIPFARQEAMAVSQHLSHARLHLGEQATLANLHRETSGCALLHLACHGLFRRDNPFFSALKLHDGWLTAANALRLRLPGAFITLSACESGRSEVIGGDELLGLTHAFLGAGASGLLISLWLVEDETTAALMTDFYCGLAQGVSRPAALRRAQLALKARYPHPYYWAPFLLIGT
jgi:CHAT domain-containing protein